MRPALATWMNGADALHYVRRLGLTAVPSDVTDVQDRQDDFYISLVGELFDRLRHPYDDPVDWSRLGNAITQAGVDGTDDSAAATGLLPADASLFASAAFYLGGYPASAYLTLRAADPAQLAGDHRSCYDLITRPQAIESADVRGLIGALRRGDLQVIHEYSERAAALERSALEVGPEEWVATRLFERMLARFETTNVRAVLPSGEDAFWDPLVRSLLNRTPPAWDFFPSQIDAIRSGLLTNPSTYSMQMPTGAGKTALSETLLFYHLKANPDSAAVLLVPYRSLASELRGSLVRRLNQMELSARCAYGGTVPTRDEVRELHDTRALVATPEALSGLLSADAEFFSRISLVICDEGHLLDGEARGVGLELLLARMRARESGPPKFVFISAIVPNIEEINAWLGGTDETVVRSDYRPALAEFAVLDVTGSGASTTVDLRLHPHQPGSTSFRIERFLSRDDFTYRNSTTGRLNTYNLSSIKTQAIATARKALSMGAVAVFAANKRGNQGAVGLAQELVSQLDAPMSLPAPMQYVSDAARLRAVAEYFLLEYGADWIGTQVVAIGAIVHHGDIPQESREVAEALVRDGCVRLAICTSTLAEGVNLPIRTLVLYSVQRRGPDGAAKNLLARDIKNLVGRAGRAGSATKGLVVCANSQQWSVVEPVATQQPGERVDGALLELMGRLRAALSQQSLVLTNAILEDTTQLHTLIDGIDATLIDLAAEELGEDELVSIARELAGETFAFRQATPDTAALMRDVFDLRARRVLGILRAGRLEWVRETGTRARMLDSVEASLLPAREHWDDIADPTDAGLLDAMVTWAWELQDLQDSVSAEYRDTVPSLETFRRTVGSWIVGRPLVEIASEAGLQMDAMLGVHRGVLTYTLQVAVEQGIGLLNKLCDANDRGISQAVLDFPEHLKFGVPTKAACILMGEGIRHRRAAVMLGGAAELRPISPDDREAVMREARRLLEQEDRWLPSLGRLVLDNSRIDLQQTAATDE